MVIRKNFLVGLMIIIGVPVLFLVVHIVTLNNEIREWNAYLLTMHRMQYLRDALDTYRAKNGHYPATQRASGLLNVLAITDYPEAAKDAWNRELRYESKGCADCGFFLGSPGRNDTFEKKFESYQRAAVYPPDHGDVVLSSQGWIQFPRNSLVSDREVMPMPTNAPVKR